MKNFKSHISIELQNKVLEFAEYVKDNLSVLAQNAEFYDEPRLTEIEGNYRDGWLPNQHGGFSVDVLVSSNMDSSYHLTKKQTEVMNEQYDNMWKDFIADNDLPDDVSWDDLTDDQQNQLTEIEYEYFEPALLQCQVFVDDGAKDDGLIINMRLSINYRDTPYYREKYAEDITTNIWSESEFMQASIEELFNAPNKS